MAICCPPATPPDCLEPDCSQQDSSQPGTSRALLHSPCPLLACRHVGDEGAAGARAQPPILPTQTAQSPKALFSSCRCSPGPSPTHLTPQGPHPPVAPASYVVTICLCLIHGWGLGRASQEREELPWGLAQFLPACPGPGPGTRSCWRARRTLSQSEHGHHLLIHSPGMSAGQSAGSPRAPRGL